MKFTTIISTFLTVFFLINSNVCFCHEYEGLILATDEFPPYSYYREEKLTGIAVDIVKELMKMADYSGGISVMSWNRALNYTKTHEMMLFPLTRLPYREKNYKWIGPIMTDSFVFAVRSSDKRVFKSIDDFRNIQVGTNSSTPPTRRLQELGFDKVQVVTAEILNAKKLVNGYRIDAWYSSHLILKHTMMKGGIDEKLIRIAYKDIDVEMFIGATLKVPDEMVVKWQKNFDEMKETGKYQKILNKSLREWGPAR